MMLMAVVGGETIREREGYSGWPEKAAPGDGCPRGQVECCLCKAVWDGVWSEACVVQTPYLPLSRRALAGLRPLLL